MKTYVQYQKHILVIFASLWFAHEAHSQVTMQINLPRILKSHSEYNFEVKVIKNGSKGYTGYEMHVPKGMSLSADEKKGYNFTYDKNNLKLVSSHLINNEETVFRLTLKSTAKGTYTIQQRLFVEGDPDNREFEVQPFVINVTDSLIPGYSFSGYTTLNSSRHASFLTPGSTITYFNDPEELTQYLWQVYQDSKEITKVGESELRKATETVEDASVILRQAEHITDEAVSGKVIMLASNAKNKATNDIEVAHKIILVAKSLEDGHTGVRGGFSKSKYTADPSMDGSVTLLLDDNTGNNEDLPLIKKGENENMFNFNEGIVYRIQVGAFKKRIPRKTTYTALGHVAILKENGFYKVLIDNFRSKEEALQKREYILSQGYDAFVTTYKNGRRLL